MSSCLIPTIQILQPSTTNPVLRPKVTLQKPPPRTQTRLQRKRKAYPIASPTSTSPSKFTKMRLAVLRNSALLSLLGVSNAQTATWAQTQPFNVDVSTESLLGSSQQPLTNIIGTNTPSTTGLAPVASITEEFSTTIPTELSTATVVVSSSVPASLASSASASFASAQSSRSSASASSASAASSRSATGSGAATQSSAAAAPVGVNGQQKMMGVAGALAGAAGVLFV